MKKNIILIIIIIILIVGGAIYYNYQKLPDDTQNIPISETSGPHVVIEPITYDFGLVKYGDVARHTFVVKNIGDQMLEINGVTTSCACTKGEMKVTNIASGEQANLDVSFDPAVHGDDTDLGKLTRTIYVSTNDPLEGEVETKIYADVYKE